jgi:Mg/Co/Ni transporter MgtE
MDEYEREFCVTDADHCGEGLFSYDDLVAMDDQELAKSVMEAWRAYVSSNC